MNATSDETAATGSPKTIAIFVYDGAEPIDVGGTFGVFSMAKRVVSGLSFFTVAEAHRTIELSSGLRMIPDFDFNDCPNADALIICGGPGWPIEREKLEVLNFISKVSKDSIVASVCTGGLILAATNLLDGLSATTRRAGIGAEISPLEILGQCHKDTKPIEARIVDCGNIITGGGVSLAIDMSLYLIERLFSKSAADDTARVIEYQAALEANKKMLPTITMQQSG